MQDFNDYVRETQTTLRVLAEETGGFAIVNQNDFDKGLKRIDAETSDYYLIGFYSNNPDPLKRNRQARDQSAPRPDRRTIALSTRCARSTAPTK